MKIRTLTTLAAMAALTAGSAYGDTLVFEDFEDATVEPFDKPPCTPAHFALKG